MERNSKEKTAEGARSSWAGFAASVAYARRTLGLVWESSRVQTLLLFVLTAVGALVPLAVAVVGKRIVDAVVSHDTAATVRAVALELVLVVLLATVQRGLGFVRQLLGARLGIDINVAILTKAVGLDLRWFEDSEFYDKLTRARREASSRPVALVTEAFQLVQNLVTLVGFAVVLVRFDLRAVLVLVVATLPATIAEMRFAKTVFRVRNWRSPESRKLLYLEYVLANDEHAKEVKLFGLGPTLLGRYEELAERFYAEDLVLARKRIAVTHGLGLLGTGAFYGAYVVMATLAARGTISLGDMTLYILAFRQGQQAFQSALGAIGAMYEHNLYMSNLFAFFDLEGAGAEPVAGAASVPEIAPVPAAERGLRFEGVGFRYPGKDTWAVRGVDLTFPEGESVALVGENGAGKTTLVKLLTKLYTPTEGRILLDGKDLRDVPDDVLRARIGVVFQDFNQYHLRVRENVGFGSVSELDDDARIARAIERGGARSVVDALDKGIEAPLGRWFQEGAELSGGQWQKIALARAFMREQADILVLDEPTAALDAEAEHAVFQRFRELAKGRTTLVISHRFPTVRMASRIVVLEGGRVLESGNHDALVAQGGKYARMFALQAEGYK
ncbi:MAG: ABC transporter ATP-binding protein [Polyangiaceae bacterium]